MKLQHKKYVVILIIVLGLGVYWNSFSNEFVFDDQQQVVDNTVIRSFDNLPEVFKHHLTSFGGEKEGKFYRPVQSITFMVDYFLWALDPLGYHITNAILHILVSILLFYISCLIIKDIFCSSIISLLYLVQPVHTEAVAYISGRADSIATIFLLLMILCQRNYWLSAAKNKRTVYYLSSLILFSLALLSKESALIFPFILIFCEYCLRNEKTYENITFKKVISYLPFFILIGVWFLLKNKIVATEVMVENVASLKTRLAIVPRLIYDYVRISIFPVNLHMEYKLPFPKTMLQEGYLGPTIFSAVFLYLFYYAWKRGKGDADYRIVFFGSGWFLLALLPYLSVIFPLNAPFAEHWLYIPQMGLILSVIYFLFYYTRKKERPRKIAVISCVIVIAIYSCLTVSQNKVWKDDFVLYTHIIKHAPYSAKAYNNLAFEYIKRGDLIKAKELFEEAVRIEPTYTTAVENLRMIRQDLRRRGISP